MCFASPDVTNFLTKSFFSPSRKTPHFFEVLNPGLPRVGTRIAFAIERNSQAGLAFLLLEMWIYFASPRFAPTCRQFLNENFLSLKP